MGIYMIKTIYLEFKLWCFVNLFIDTHVINKITCYLSNLLNIMENV